MYFITKIDIFRLEFLIREITYLFKYFYLPVTSICLINCFDSLRLDKEKIGKIFMINVIVFATLIIVPHFTNTAFASYYGNNSGSVGWFYAANEVGAILTLLFPYLYKFGYQNKTNKPIWTFPIRLVARASFSRTSPALTIRSLTLSMRTFAIVGVSSFLDGRFGCS